MQESWQPGILVSPRLPCGIRDSPPCLGDPMTGSGCPSRSLEDCGVGTACTAKDGVPGPQVTRMGKGGTRSSPTAQGLGGREATISKRSWKRSTRPCVQSRLEIVSCACAVMMRWVGKEQPARSPGDLAGCRNPGNLESSCHRGYHAKSKGLYFATSTKLKAR